ncbi:MAG: response regulator transcription factor [Myxococcales bacterium]
MLVFTMYELRARVRQALAEGAKAYVTKRDSAQALDEAIAAVRTGGTYLSPRAKVALEELPGEESMKTLSDQEREVFELLGQARSTAEIAERLRIGVRTVETYYRRMVEKLGLPNVRALRHEAVERRVSSVEDRPVERKG